MHADQRSHRSHGRKVSIGDGEVKPRGQEGWSSRRKLWCTWWLWGEQEKGIKKGNRGEARGGTARTEPGEEARHSSDGNLSAGRGLPESSENY